MSTRIALLDASIGDTPAERNILLELDAEVDVFELSEGVFPPAVSAKDCRYEGAVVSGSRSAF